MTLRSRAVTAAWHIPALVSAVLAVLAVGWLGTGTAMAVGATTIAAPQADAVISGPFTVTASVDVEDGELIQAVRVSLAGTPARSWSLTADGPPDTQGRQRWTQQVDPLAAGAVVANGPHQLIARATAFSGASAESGRRAISVRAPARSPLTARPSRQDAQTVQLSWEPVSLPDFVAYRIQRKPDNPTSPWATVGQVTDSQTAEAIDVVDTVDSYRYRLVVVRADGEGGEVLGASAARGVRADPANPGTFDPAPDPASAAPGDPPADPDGSTADPGAGAPQGRPGQVGQGDPDATTPGPVTGPTASPAVQPPATPQATVRPPPQPPVTAPPVAAIPLDDGVFESLLPIGPTRTELTVRETETAFQDGSLRPGGTVAVLTEERVDRGVLVSGATGLLLLVVAGHVRRFLAIPS